ncbi:transcription antitermination factor NusB [Clostridium tagluense]|uniref:Transcription antitermination protein NusB n=1 Tax=Clostridium tagluense TaxID=360422 RepID=A0A401UIU6_9CLOT|nr:MULTISPECIES: transcription antitermination factor NusB [Clostridium]MBU3126571.1 transcription antitermination factor NusB [Clostridium tagluense]MBW9156309.1 transcription antitermination factor NusB [Clostridium tagluense]MBZ9624464.1 transcription antitermination factor NusB [Clostridium sp. FP2]MCB2297090.1 transcription antitermination factor NusB [Clostridium tagluense]MCB2309939.1 transcription antitermination factor NusB [Clostridium tagluense]
MNRRKSREVAMKLLFEMSINKESYEEIIENFKEYTDVDLNDVDMSYITRVLAGIHEHGVEIDKNIEKHLIKWKLDRLSKMNLAILRISTYEILFEEEIPSVVSVNEGIELAKKYGEDASPAFINGILAKMI